VSALPAVTAAQVAGLLGPNFQVETVGRGEQGARDTWELIEADGSQTLLGVGTVADSLWQTARLQAPAGSAAMDRLAADHSPAWRSLGVSVLHVLLLDHLLGPGLNAKPECKYVHLLREVTEATASKSCQLAVLVPPATMQHVAEIAGNLEKMPPKSTYFYPKLLTGLVFNSLKTA
jgi:hypothetical protein